ncbi:NAD(P)/FAD-dependent oxidoreductase [Haloprofundus halobius]|uniref:NAD(P)/FAD-dependent oxidoreductase n=1 Tax=Haloprofundus halobius TaxID=2876194 RepID=UPI001CCBA10C|nr:NAD(P)/FAD-dependent oxidoreductase [Haloprofundus halobius]
MISVVGGGIAGLACAYRLQQHGHDVRVFEATDEVGGLAAVYETKGDPIEKFYHHLSKSEETIVELAEELGVGDRLEWLVGKNGYYFDGAVYPMDTPWEILAFPHLSLYDKFRLTMLTQEIDVREGRPKFDTYENLEAFEHVPLKDFIVDHTTQNVYDNFFEPLLDAKFGSRKDDVSAAWLLGRVKFRGERDLLRGEILGYFRGGFAPFVDALADAVGRENIVTNARVTGLEMGDDGVESITVERDGSAAAAADGGAAAESISETPETDTTATTYETDAVVCATMPNVLEDLTGYQCEIDFQGAVCAVLTMDEQLTDTYWLNVAHDAPFGALIEHTNFVPPERYGGDHLMYVASYIQDYEEELWQLSDAEVEETWLSELETMFPNFHRRLVSEFRLARNPRAAPVYERGYRDMVVPYDLGDDIGEGVYYAGMASAAQYPERSLNGGIVAGYECADRIERKGRAD